MSSLQENVCNYHKRDAQNDYDDRKKLHQTVLSFQTKTEYFISFCEYAKWKRYN